MLVFKIPALSCLNPMLVFFLIQLPMLLLIFSFFFNKEDIFLLVTNPLQRTAHRYSKLVSNFFDMKGLDNVLSFLSRHNEMLEVYCEALMHKIAPEYVAHYKHIITILMIRKKLFEVSSVSKTEMDVVSAACHQNFMCVVMQLRVWGEIRSLKPVAEFKRSFVTFLHMLSKDNLIKRLVNIGEELRHIETLLATCGPEDVLPLKARFDHCVDDIQSVVGKANAMDMVSNFLLSTAYEPDIPASI